MPSPHLAIPHVVASQNQKEVTINDAIDEIGSVKIYGNLHESVAEIIDAAR